MGSLAEVLSSRRKELGYTLAEIANKMGVSEATVQRWESGNIKSLRHEKIAKLADVLRVSPGAIMGWEDFYNPIPPGFEPLPETEKVPLVGSIACGEPITAEENIEGYVDAPKEKRVDFCLTCKGDSMIDAGIYDGDIVYIHQQAEVENGEIAAVRIENEATLKRFYYDGAGKVMLLPANSKYAPLIYSGEEINNIHIEGKAVGFAHWF